MDQEAIRRVLAGNTNAFRELVERYQGAVLAFVRSVVVDPAETEDVAQDVFLAAFRNLHRYDSTRGQFSTWLLVIARNKAINAVQRRRPRAGFEYDEPVDPDTPDTNLHGSEVLQQLKQALQALPLDQRTAFVLCHLHDLSYEEVSRIEDVPLGTVKSRIARARTKLQSTMRALLEK